PAARSAESGRATIDSLPEVVRVFRDRVPVLVDGGFRRGTDVFKALALGARAICIGRPYMWGVAAFGQPGVETVLAILRREFNLVMAQCGKQSIGDIRASSIVTARRGGGAGGAGKAGGAGGKNHPALPALPALPAQQVSTGPSPAPASRATP